MGDAIVGPSRKYLETISYWENLAKKIPDMEINPNRVGMWVTVSETAQSVVPKS